jgi:hypothetical protein
MGLSGQLHATADVPPTPETTVHIAQEAGWAPHPVWTFRRKQVERNECRQICHKQTTWHTGSIRIATDEFDSREGRASPAVW